jgi:alkanesulfonate monooxygenase SsuD/methylene tetrahydromethanopterin reductase-like flavin-dependent oxidoreductase (luciferase family)
MQVGISVSSTYQGPAAEGSRWMIERAAAAASAGLVTLSVGDGHLSGDKYYQNSPMLGRLLAEWSGRPAGCLFVLPLWHPVIVAEQIATLASLHDDTFIVQTGVGGRPHEFAGMGVRLADRGRRTDEAIGVVKALLAGDTVSSRLFGLADAQMGLRPERPVEWWIGAGAPVGIERAARSGDAWYTSPYETAAELVDPVERYLDACAQHDRTPRIMARKDVLVLDDAAAAERHAKRLLDAGYRGLDRTRVVVGDVDSVLEQLGPFEELGIEQIIMRCMAVPQSAALETIAGMGEVNRRLDIDLR